MDAIEILKSMGLIVYACAKVDDGPGSQCADYFKQLDFSDIDKLIKYIKDENFDCVLSVGSDSAMLISAEISELLNLPCFVSSFSAKLCNHKDEMRSYLGNDYEWSIKYQVLKNDGEIIMLDYPFIMKPSDSQGQRGVKLVADKNCFINEFQRTKSYSKSGYVILEEYLEGIEMSVNSYMVNGKVVFLAISDRVTWPQFDAGLIHKHVVPSKYLNNSLENDIYELVKNTAGRLNIKNGPIYFQIKLKNSKPKIIEVTPRLDGCHMWKVLSCLTGVNLLKLNFEHLLYGKTDELSNMKMQDKRYAMEFMCQQPGTPADYSRFKIPDTALYTYKYYKDGEIVKAVNGRYEKIGYYIATE